ncbi:MAG TPA: class I SAM-dependent methyltransferase [Gaiellaceae bacterium]
MSSAEDDRIAANVAQWTKTNAEHTDADAARQWNDPALKWGVFEIEDAWLGDVAGRDVVELGAGTAYVAAKLTRAGARVVAVDPTPAQLATARRLQQETGIDFELVEAPAESVPLPDSSFDVAISEYGASLWADPEKWVAEAARLLRPGGRLFFLTMSTLAHLCTPDADDESIGNELVRAQFAPWAAEGGSTAGVSSHWETRWEGYEGAEFHLSHGDWIRVLRANGFTIDALHELQAPPDAKTHEYYYVIPAEWGRRWPGEDLWECTKTR